MTSPFILDVLRESLALLEERFPVLSDPPATTEEAAIAVLCCRLRYAIFSEQPEGPADDPFGPDLDEGDGGEWDPDSDDDWQPVGEEYRPYGWQPFLWEDLDHPDFPDTDASGSCFSDADPGL